MTFLGHILWFFSYHLQGFDTGLHTWAPSDQWVCTDQSERSGMGVQTNWNFRQTNWKFTVVYTLLKKHAFAVLKCQKNGPSDQSEITQDQSWPQGTHMCGTDYLGIGSTHPCIILWSEEFSSLSLRYVYSEEFFYDGELGSDVLYNNRRHYSFLCPYILSVSQGLNFFSTSATSHPMFLDVSISSPSLQILLLYNCPFWGVFLVVCGTIWLSMFTFW